MLIEAVFREYNDGLVRAITAYANDQQAAMDAVQHAFTKALVNKADFEQMPEPAMRAWLYTAARNAVIDIKRKQRRLVYDLDENLEYHQLDPTDMLTVNIMLSKLPPHLKEPVCLKYFSQMTSTEIGHILGLPPATVRTRLKKAINMMRDMMKGD